jgi:hypothetical protein
MTHTAQGVLELIVANTDTKIRMKPSSDYLMKHDGKSYVLFADKKSPPTVLAREQEGTEIDVDQAHFSVASQAAATQIKVEVDVAVPSKGSSNLRLVGIKFPVK